MWIAGVIVVLVVAIGAFAIARPKKTVQTSTTTTSNQAAAPATTPSAATTDSTASSAVTVAFDNNGFSPATVTVKSGGTITFKNTSSGAIQPSSDPHPAHTDNPELNVGVIAAGQSKTITVKNVGTWGMHDHFNESMRMDVVIQ
jgi:plastocyanin